MKVKSESEVAQSCPTLRDSMDAAYQAPPSMGFSRQEYWSGVPSPSQHHLSEFGQTLRDGEGQGGLARCSPWGHKESDMTE